MDYQLEIKQIVDYPRCRIYREFFRTLMANRDIRTSGSSYLFYYMTLCSYANFRSSYRRLEGISYLIEPGEWICKTSELAEWFRTRFQHQAVSILDFLQEQHYISYTRLGRGNLIKFSITGWKKNNTSLDYNYPCLKDVGFFFFPVAAVHELISMGRCSEMDIVLDLWIHAIYNGVLAGCPVKPAANPVAGGVGGGDQQDGFSPARCLGGAGGKQGHRGQEEGSFQIHREQNTQQATGQRISFTGILYRTAWQRHLSVQLSFHHVQHQ